jgi:hypothetical protein
MSVIDLFDTLKLDRKRKPISKRIVDKALKEVDKIKKIPYKTKDWGFHWGENPYTQYSLIVDLPHIEITDLKPYKTNIKDKVVFYDEKRIKKEGFKYVDKSCVITHKGEILIVYITAEFDPAIKKATERLVPLGEAMEKYYPVKASTFYSAFKIKAKTKEEKIQANITNLALKENPRYYGKNWMDGQIKYFKGGHSNVTGTMISYQPRKPDAFQDEQFLYDLIYSYCSLYELEKRYAPAVAKWRLELAQEAGKVPAIPGVPLERHPATGCGASLDFASAIHNDSGMNGLTETIFWNTPDKNHKQLFVSPQLKCVFDLTKHNCIILQPPKIPHGTVNSGNHNGYGYVNITKQNLVAKTDLNKEWYKKWKNYLSTQAEKDFDE